MLGHLLKHKIRKDLLRFNKKHNHKQYLFALDLPQAIRYWSGYHKKKLIALVIFTMIGWTYDFHQTIYDKITSLRSPMHMLEHMFDRQQKEKRILDMQYPTWRHSRQIFELLSKVYYQSDKRLIFGVGRNFLFQVFTELGMLKKPQEQANFWSGGGFYRKRNQLVSGVSFKQFMWLFEQGYKKLKKERVQLDEQTYLKQFMGVFMSKAEGVQRWQKGFNKNRHNQYLKSLHLDGDVKTDQINRLMRNNMDISQQQVQKSLIQSGMRGLGARDRWLYWTNRETLLRVRSDSVGKRLGFGIDMGRQRSDLQMRMKGYVQQLKSIQSRKEGLKNGFREMYEQQLI